MKKRGARGQAMLEGALVVGVLFLFAMLGITAVPLHKAHTAAVSAAYACAQFITQHPDHPEKAANAGYDIAREALGRGWNALAGARFRMTVEPPRKRGQDGVCSVTYTVHLLFDPFGFGDQTRRITLVGRSERWKADP